MTDQVSASAAERINFFKALAYQKCLWAEVEKFNLSFQVNIKANPFMIFFLYQFIFCIMVSTILLSLEPLRRQWSASSFILISLGATGRASCYSLSEVTDVVGKYRFADAELM